MSVTYNSIEEWEEKGRKLFGENKDNWRFKCPSCGLVQSISWARTNYPELRGSEWLVYQECIGRYKNSIGCDWAAYGFFRVTDSIRDGDKEIFVFTFHEKPIKYEN